MPEPLRHPARARPRHRHLRRRGGHPGRGSRRDGRDPAERGRAHDHARRGGGAGRDPARRHGLARPGERPRSTCASRARSTPASGRLRLVVPGHPERPAPRLLPQHLQGRRRADARHGRDAVRGDRRAARVPVLGRARASRRCSASRWSCPTGYTAISNTAPVREEPAGPGKRAVTFADTIRMSTYLVAFIVGELESTEPVMVGQDAAPRLVRAGQGPPGRLRADGGGVLPRLLRALLRHPVPRRQARPPRDPRLRGGRDGEPGRDHLPRDRAPGRRGGRVARRARARGRRGRPRGRPHVVRRPRDDGRGGTASGSTRRSPPSWRCSRSTPGSPSGSAG